jgi:general secretion pathway protein G
MEDGNRESGMGNRRPGEAGGVRSSHASRLTPPVSPPGGQSGDELTVSKRCACLGNDSRFPIPDSRPRFEKGFTLLELLVVMTIIGILAAIAVPALRDSPQRAREAALKEDLFALRSVIDQYHGDKGNYPPDLQTLVTDGYVRKIPLDPMTKSAETWVVAYEEAPAADAAGSDPASPGTPGIIDVHSGSPAKALDGTLYKDW